MTHDTWEPDFGRLVVRRVDYRGIPSEDMELLFYERGKRGGVAYKTMARRSLGETKPYFGSGIEGAVGAVCATIAGNRVVRRYATDDDILGLARTWTANVPFATWLASVANADGLHEEDRARLAALAEKASAT